MSGVWSLSPEDEDAATTAFIRQLGKLGGVPTADAPEARYRFRIALVAAFAAVRARAASQGPTGNEMGPR